MPDEEKLQERQRVAAREAATRPAQALDETRPGGRYLVDGQLVDCEGKPVKGA